MYIFSKHIYFEDGIKNGYLEIEGGKIKGFHETCKSQDVIDYGDALIIPGFIDIHLHGWGTGSFMHEKSTKSLYEMKKNLPYEGVTSFLATSGAEPIEDIKQGIKVANEVCEKQFEDGADLLGVHLEGPFINKEFKGMQREDCCIDSNLTIMKEFMECESQKGIIKLMTIAPELDGSREVIEFCHEHNIQLSIGHSAATFDEIKELKNLGLGGVTHMFSGMKGLHHRELGVAGAAMYFPDLYCEFAKQTGMTVKPEAFAIVYRLKGPEKIIMTTDCGGMAKTKKEKYHYIRKQTMIPKGDTLILRNDDGSELAYDTTKYENVRDLELSYIKSIKNLINNVHPSVYDVIKMTAENPAKYVHVFDKKGSIAIGKDADLLVINEAFDIEATYCLGKKYVYGEVKI